MIVYGLNGDGENYFYTKYYFKKNDISYNEWIRKSCEALYKKKNTKIFGLWGIMPDMLPYKNIHGSFKDMPYRIVIGEGFGSLEKYAVMDVCFKSKPKNVRKI